MGKLARFWLCSATRKYSDSATRRLEQSWGEPGRGLINLSGSTRTTIPLSAQKRSFEARPTYPLSATSGIMQRSIIRSERSQSWSDGETGLALPPTAEKDTSVILVLNQYKSIGCSPGRHPDTRTMATGSNGDSRDSVHDRRLCIAA